MKQVVACIDGSAAARAVADYAGWAAGLLDVPLMLLHVLDEKRYPREADLSGNIGLGTAEALQKQLADIDQRRNQLALEQGRVMLEAAREQVANHFRGDPALRQRHGDLVGSLRDLEDDTGLFVIGKQGEAHQQPGEFLGDNVERVVRALHRPILIAVGEFAVPRRVMIAFDGSATMKEVVERLAGSRLFGEVECHLVSVGDEPASLAEARARLEGAGHSLQVKVLPGGDVEQALHDYQAEANIDLVVMGAYGHSRIREFFVGSTTNALLRKATVPHLIFR